MKLALCLFNYFPFGGLQRDFLRIAKECVQRGHEVNVLTMEWQGEKDPAIPVTLLPVKGLQNHTRNKNYVAAVQKQLAEQSHDLVIGFNKMPGLDVYYAADTCYQAKARQQHGAWYRCLPRYQQLVAYEKAVFAKQHRTHILLIAKNQQTEFANFYQTPAERFSLLPPGIAKDRVAPENAAEIRQQTRQEFNLSDRDLLLLMVGSGFKTKGLDRALKGVAALPFELKNRVQLFVVGQDNHRIFQQQARQLQIEKQIHFLGGRSDVPRFLLAADVLLHPAYNENTGTVLLEAVVSGLPVLTTDVCGYANYINEAKAGMVLSTPFKQNDFNQTLITMLSSHAHRDMWKSNGLLFAQQADIYSMPVRAVDKIESLL